MFTAPPNAADRISDVSQAIGEKVTKIGIISGHRNNVKVVDAEGEEIVVSTKGYCHF